MSHTIEPLEEGAIRATSEPRGQPRSNRSLLSRVLAILALSCPAIAPADTYRVLGWNDLGMHCMDADYSVFAILPPYNNLHAQLVNATTGKLVGSGATITFESTADTRGSVNAYSLGKTNFWDWDLPLFGVDLPPGVGLTGFGTASTTPQALVFDPVTGMHAAPGIPITPIDDNLQVNTYPMAKLVARDGRGAVLGEASVVLPVSDEMTCIACHASGSDRDARPTHGWVHDPRGPQQDFRRNVLSLHDDRQLGTPKYTKALRALGLDPAGLLATSDGGHPILCAACHASNALPGTGLAHISALTSAIHTLHATVINPQTGLPLDDGKDRASCYMCHPGSKTQCLRGVMGNATRKNGQLAIQCQSCHARMVDVGSPARTGWLDQPNCQACHHDGKRSFSAVDANGHLKHPSDTRFATNPDMPQSPFSLYRFSAGHGKLQCEACHGSTHAEFATSEANDNVLSIMTQGHAGTLSECTACHQAQALSVDGGPHGLHTLGQAWVKGHGDRIDGHTGPCSYCHGKDFRGSPLSATKAARSFRTEQGVIKYAAGQQVTCYDCHNGPGGGSAQTKSVGAR